MPATETYEFVNEPSPYTPYFSYSLETEQFLPFSPTPVQWTDYYTAPSAPLFYYEPSTDQYLSIPSHELSPYADYYTFDQFTQTYTVYEPTYAQWTSVFEEPTADLYYYEPATQEYIIDEEPSPYVDYFTYNVATQNYEGYEPSPIEWTSYFEEPATQLYSFVESTNSFEP